MKFKLDENLGYSSAALFARAGHDVATVPSQALHSATDHELIEICRREHRCLVTLDLDFSNPFLFKPSAYAGIAVLRLPPKPGHDDLVETLQTLINGFGSGEY